MEGNYPTESESVQIALRAIERGATPQPGVDASGVYCAGGGVWAFVLDGHVRLARGRSLWIACNRAGVDQAPGGSPLPSAPLSPGSTPPRRSSASAPRGWHNPKS